VARRRASKQAHWRKLSARRKTAARTYKWRTRQREIETDIGSRKVGPTPIVSGAERSAVTETALSHAQETSNGIDLDGHLAEPHGDPCGCNGGGKRNVPQSTVSDGAKAPTGARNVAGSGSPVAGASGPRCAVCGKSGRFVRLQPLSRCSLGRQRRSVQRRLGPRQRTASARPP